MKFNLLVLLFMTSISFAEQWVVKGKEVKDGGTLITVVEDPILTLEVMDSDDFYLIKLGDGKLKFGDMKTFIKNNGNLYADPRAIIAISKKDLKKMDKKIHHISSFNHAGINYVIGLDVKSMHEQDVILKQVD